MRYLVFVLLLLSSPVPGGEISASECAALEGGWVDGWFAALDHVEKELGLSPAPPAALVFYDAECVWNRSPGAAEWLSERHGGILRMPDGAAVPVGLMSFAAPVDGGGGYFVMAAPSFWEAAGVNSAELGRERLMTAVFIHEVSHIRQLRGYGGLLDAIESDGGTPEGLNDDIVQARFESSPEYREAWSEERDLLFEAADAASEERVRALARAALTRMQQRHQRWFVDDASAYRVLDSLFLSLEGAGQMLSFRWLVSPGGGGVGPASAIAGLRRGGNQWSQDHGLALFLVLDRLLPEWPQLVYGEEPIGAEELLRRAVGQPGSATRIVR